MKKYQHYYDLDDGFYYANITTNLFYGVIGTYFQKEIVYVCNNLRILKVLNDSPFGIIQDMGNIFHFVKQKNLKVFTFDEYSKNSNYFISHYSPFPTVVKLSQNDFAKIQMFKTFDNGRSSI